jgi:hypothetical protein
MNEDDLTGAMDVEVFLLVRQFGEATLENLLICLPLEVCDELVSCDIRASVDRLVKSGRLIVLRKGPEPDWQGNYVPGPDVAFYGAGEMNVYR